MAKSRSSNGKAATKIAKKLSDDRAKGYLADEKHRRFRTNIANMSTAIARQTEIANHKSEESIPALLQVLLEIREALKKEQAVGVASDGNNNNNNAEVDNVFAKNVADSLEVVNYAVDMFGETDRILQLPAVNVNPFSKAPSKKSELGKLVPEDVIAELKDLLGKVGTVTVTPNTLDLWLEAVTWLEGIYNLTAFKVQNLSKVKEKPKADATEAEEIQRIEKWKVKEKIKGEVRQIFPRVDFDDKTFFMITNMTKMDISMYYHLAAMRIRLKIKEFKDQLRYSQQQEIDDVLEPQYDQELDAVAEGRVVSATRAEEDEKNFIYRISIDKKHVELAKQICDMINDLLTNKIVHDLRKYNKSPTDVRLAAFETALDCYKLSRSQEIMLSSFRAEARAAILSYLQNQTWRNQIAGLLNSNWGAPHAKIVRDTVQELDQADSIKEHLHIMLRLRSKLKGEDSTKLLSLVNDILTNTIDRLCPRIYGEIHDVAMQQHSAFSKVAEVTNGDSSPQLKREESAELKRKSSDEQGVVMNEKEDYMSVKVTIPKEYSEVASLVCRIVQDMLSQPLSFSLQERFINPEIGFSNLEAGLKQFGLTEFQCKSLQNLARDASEQLNGYLNESRARNYLWWPTHHKLATDTKDLLEKIPDVKGQLLTLLDLRNKLIGEGSVRLLGRVNSVLSVSLDLLCPQQLSNDYTQINYQEFAREMSMPGLPNPASNPNHRRYSLTRQSSEQLSGGDDNNNNNNNNNMRLSGRYNH